MVQTMRLERAGILVNLSADTRAQVQVNPNTPMQANPPVEPKKQQRRVYNSSLMRSHRKMLLLEHPDAHKRGPASLLVGANKRVMVVGVTRA